MKNTSVVSISNLVKRFPMGSDFFMALKGIDLSKLTKEQKRLMKNKPSTSAINRIIVEQSDIDFDDESLIGD